MSAQRTLNVAVVPFVLAAATQNAGAKARPIQVRCDCPSPPCRCRLPWSSRASPYLYVVKRVQNEGDDASEAPNG